MRFPLLEDLGLSVAAMSDVRDGDCASSEDRHAVCGALGLRPERLCLPKQVHGDRVLRARPSDSVESSRREGDGLSTGTVNLPLGVLVADCVPVFLFDPVQRVAGIVHAGRIGTESGVTLRAVRGLERDFKVDAANLHVVIGPSAGPCCYEVSEEMAQAFARSGFSIRGRRLDLWDANVRQLEQGGIPRKQVHVEGVCTICDGRYHSQRSSAEGRRNLALVCL